MKYGTVILTFVTFLSLVTSFSVNDQDPQCFKQTQCFDVDLSIYNYTQAIVKSGYLSVPSKKGSALAFTFYGKIGVTQPQLLKNYPIILWLGGGPGASSQLNNLQEVGPLRLSKIFSLVIKNNTDSWAKDYNLLFIDQPVGTGFSCASDDSQYATQMEQVVKDLWEGINQLYNNQTNGCFGSKQLNISSNTPLFIFGESYGGKFAPAFASWIINKQKTSEGFLKGLKGVGIGDGFTHPMKIFSEVSNHAYHLSLINYQERIQVEKMLLKTYFHMEQNRWAEMMADYFNAMNFIYQKSGVSYYNIQKSTIQAPLIEDYFKDPKIIELYQFDPTLPFQPLFTKVTQKLADDFMRSQVHDVEYILQNKIPVLVYQGQDDLIVSSSGTLQWIDQLQFEGSTEFRKKSLDPWQIEGEKIGFMKDSGLLSYKMILNAGHFVPKDAPKPAYMMARQFISKHIS